MGISSANVLSVEEFNRRVMAELALLRTMLDEERQSPGKRFAFFDSKLRYPTAGAELEAHIVNRHSRPATGDANLRIQQRLADFFPETGSFSDLTESRYRLTRRRPSLNPGVPSWCTLEVGSNTIELISDLQSRSADALLWLEMQLIRRARLVGRAAKELGFALSFLANLPTIRPEDLTWDNILTQGPKRVRYEALFRAMQQNANSRHILDFRSRDPEHPENLVMEFDSPIPVVTICAWQTHLGIHPVNFSRIWNLLALVDTMIAAGSCNGAPLFGRRLGKDIRYDMWRCAVGGGREGLVETGPPDYMDEADPYDALFSYFKRVAEKPVLFPADVDCDPDFPFPYLAFKNGTCWTMLARPCLGKVWDDKEQRWKVALRLESRIEGSGPIPELCAQFWGKLCMLDTLISQDRHAGEIVPSMRDLKKSAHDAMFRGLDGELIVRGKPTSFRQLWQEDVMPRVLAGHDALRLTAATKDRYLPLLEARLRGSGADRADEYWQQHGGKDPYEIASDYVGFCYDYSNYATMREALGL